MRADVAFYVSGHGFGHASRTRALIGALAKRAPELRLHVRSEVPVWLFRVGEAPVTCSRAQVDVGMLQHGGLDLDLPATLAAHQAFLAGWEQALARESAWLASCGARLVVGDVPPLAFAAARRARVRSLAVANFGWDWIVEEFAASDPRWRPIHERYRQAYSEADRLYRLPFHGDFSAFREVVDAPLLVNRSHRSRRECREALGVGGDGRRLVLVSFGGFGAGPVSPRRPEDLSPYRFAGVGDPPRGFPGDWLSLPPDAATPHEDWVQASDALLGKVGYSTVAEVIAHGVAFLHLSREGFREAAVLERGLARHARARAMPRADFGEGRWRAHLDALLAQPAPCEPLACDGAEVIAGALLASLQSSR